MVANIPGLITYPTDKQELLNYENYGIKKFETDFICLYFGSILFYSFLFSIFMKLLLNTDDLEDHELKKSIFSTKINFKQNNGVRSNSEGLV